MKRRIAPVDRTDLLRRGRLLVQLLQRGDVCSAALDPSHVDVGAPLQDQPPPERPRAAGCSVDTSNFPSQSVAVNQYIYGKALFDTTATTPGDVKTHTHSFPFHFEDPSWAGPSNSVADTQVPVRCDNAVPGYSVTGCVYPQYTPSVSYSRTGSYPVLAQHIADTQASGLHGAYPAGTPLTRLTKQRAYRCEPVDLVQEQLRETTRLLVRRIRSPPPMREPRRGAVSPGPSSTVRSR